MTHEHGKRIIFGTMKKTDDLTAQQASSIVDAPFPSKRTIYWAPKKTTVDIYDGSDAIPRVSIVVSQEVLLQVNAHVSQSSEYEQGGFLLGNRYRCPNTNLSYVIIDQYSKSKLADSTSVSLRFTHEAWESLSDELTGKFRGKLMVGWYHSHPRMGVFLSDQDLVIHRERFNKPWMYALVIDPEQHSGGFFGWRGGDIHPHIPLGFFELLEHNSRESVVAWVNYVGADQLTGV